MIIIFLIISIILLALGVKLMSGKNDNYGVFGFFIFIVGFIVGGISIIALVTCATDVGKLKVVDEKIAMYEEENTAIESQIDKLVSEYMDYEKETFSDIKPDVENSIYLVSLYPELKSDTLVQTQIEVYTANSNKIKELKENKLDYQVSKWWLYFG